MNPSSPSPALPLVTVITPAANVFQSGGAASFRECVESVHQQTYGHLEHLVVDAGSTDGTRELVAEYEAKGWLHCHSVPPCGEYEAMNHGLARARGKYTVFLSPTASWHEPQGIALSVHTLERLKLDYTYASHEMLGEGNRPLGEHHPAMGLFFCVRPFALSTMLCRTELLRELGGLKHELFQDCADHDLMLSLIHGCYKGAHVPLCFTRLHMEGEAGCAARESALRWRLQLLRHWYAPTIGEEAAEKLNDMVVPDEFIRAITTMLPDKVRRLVECHHHPAPPPQAPPPPEGTIWCGPFGLPLFSCTTRNRDGRTKFIYKLLALLPVLVCNKRTQNDGSTECRYKLFGLLPIRKTRTRAATTTPPTPQFVPEEEQPVGFF